MTAEAELRIFALCLCSGALIGLSYDIMSLFRLLFKSVVVDALFDLLFYACALFISAAALFLFNDGIIRFYCIFGIIFGVFLYMRFPSRVFRFLGRKTSKFVHK